MSILSVDDLSITFGGVRAVDGVSFDIAEGLVFSIIGPNGAGKTTLFNLISGLYVPQDGRVLLAGEDVSGWTPEQLARRGLSRTFQNLQIFFRLTALENVMVGRHRHERTGIFTDLLHLPAVERQNRATREASNGGARPRRPADDGRPAGGHSCLWRSQAPRNRPRARDRAICAAAR